MNNAADIAQYLVKVYKEANDTITHSKLQKLLYYIQGWHLAIYETPAFQDDFEAHIQGPIIPALYNIYKDTYNQPISNLPDNIYLVPLFISHVHEILDVYGQEKDNNLQMRIYNELPYKEAYAKRKDKESSTISKESMQLYFRNIIKCAT